MAAAAKEHGGKVMFVGTSGEVEVVTGRLSEQDLRQRLSRLA